MHCQPTQRTQPICSMLQYVQMHLQVGSWRSEALSNEALTGTHSLATKVYSEAGRARGVSKEHDTTLDMAWNGIPRTLERTEDTYEDVRGLQQHRSM